MEANITSVSKTQITEPKNIFAIRTNDFILIESIVYKVIRAGIAKTSKYPSSNHSLDLVNMNDNTKLVKKISYKDVIHVIIKE